MKITVICEKQGDACLELLSHARKMAPAAQIIALAEQDAECSNQFGTYGADEIAVLPWQEDNCLQGSRLTAAIEQLEPDIVLFPATIRGRFLSAWAAARLNTGLTADCTDLQITEEGLLKQVRPAFGGNLMAEILCRHCRPQMASVRPGVFLAQPCGDPERKLPVQLLTTEEMDTKLKVQDVVPLQDHISLQNARVIVAGGKGIGSAAGFRKLQELATLLGGAVGATRSAVDAGWIGYEHQIGQTGITVHPDLYIAFGVSGLVQHAVGMSSSRTVIAVNTDRNALIFRNADFGIVADWEKTADEMIKILKERIPE